MMSPHTSDADSGASGEPCDRVRMLAMGRVQGVGFRWTVQLLARELGVRGTVRNLRDGSVEVWGEAEQETLIRFAGGVFRGSTAGRVVDLRLNWGAAGGPWNEFEIIG